jgi:hypothetical protein
MQDTEPGAGRHQYRRNRFQLVRFLFAVVHGQRYSSSCPNASRVQISGLLLDHGQSRSNPSGWPLSGLMSNTVPFNASAGSLSFWKEFRKKSRLLVQSRAIRKIRPVIFCVRSSSLQTIRPPRRAERVCTRGAIRAPAPHRSLSRRMHFPSDWQRTDHGCFARCTPRQFSPLIAH